MPTEYCKECKIRVEATKKDKGRPAFTGNTKDGTCLLGFSAPTSETAAVNLVKNNGFSSICGNNPYRNKCRDMLVKNIDSRERVKKTGN